LASVERLKYSRTEGLRTPKTSLHFKSLSSAWDGKKVMAHLEGETSNQLFETLEEWEAQLQALDFDL